MGTAGYLDYIEVQRSLFVAEQQYVNLKELRLSNGVALYLALGGGWTEEDDQE